METYININGWESKIRFSSAHIIPEYEKCGRLHGHTYAVHIKIYGKPDKNGIIIDFALLKDILNKIVFNLDHKILIPVDNKNVIIEKQKNSIKLTSSNKKYEFPIEDCVLLPISSTSAELLSKYILNNLIKKISKINNINKIELGIDEGFGQGARIIKEL